MKIIITIELIEHENGLQNILTTIEGADILGLPEREEMQGGIPIRKAAQDIDLDAAAANLRQRIQAKTDKIHQGRPLAAALVRRLQVLAQTVRRRENLQLQLDEVESRRQEVKRLTEGRLF